MLICRDFLFRTLVDRHCAPRRICHETFDRFRDSVPSPFGDVLVLWRLYSHGAFHDIYEALPHISQDVLFDGHVLVREYDLVFLQHDRVAFGDVFQGQKPIWVRFI